MGIYEATIKDIINQYLYFPCLITLVSSAFLIRQAIRLIRAIRHKQYHLNPSRLVAYIFSIVGFSLLLSIQCSLLRHGIFLPFEKAEELIYVIGTVDETERDKLSPRLFLSYSDGRSYSYASTVIIDGEEYYCLTDADLAVGDVVEVAFLPKSKVILQCSWSIEEGG